jgi:hypothetical protein
VEARWEGREVSWLEPCTWAPAAWCWGWQQAELWCR